MSVREYIGARYVPLFADPIDWDNTIEYEPLTIVYNAGNSYTSRQYVPKGIEITNTTYWALTGNYNAQIEQYRAEVKAYDEKIMAVNATANDANTKAGNALSLAKTNETDIATLDAEMAGTTDSGLKTLIGTETKARELADAAEVSARELADTALGTRIDGEKSARETADTSISQMNGIKNAKFMVFSDDSATATDGETVWEYLKIILNNPNLNISVNTAPENTGWVNKNASGQNAELYITSVSQSVQNKDDYTFVILNFGWYDIKNSCHTSDYEDAGRSIVNTVKQLYQNAIIVVNPVSNNYCYQYNRGMQLEMYALNYGMVRSQVPVRVVPWYVAFNINQLSDNHYDDAASNPSKMNSGGTESIGAIIKEALFGNMHGYMRGSRYMLSNYVTNYFTANIAEFMFDPVTMSCKLTSGTLTANQEIAHSDNDLIVGTASPGLFNVNDDIILAACIQNTQNEPLKGFLVLKANNQVVFRMASSTTTVSDGAILRLLPNAAFIPSVSKN